MNKKTSWLRQIFAQPELIILTLLSALTRFWNVLSPHSVVFDEVYFKKFAGSYLTGSYYFDIHPPLGKLLLAGWAFLCHIPAQNLVGDDPSTLMRLLPAFAGTLIIPVFYLLLRQLGLSHRLSMLGGILLLLENALLVESRFILIDSLLLLFGFSAITAYLAARRHHGWPRRLLLVISALLAGAAASTKWTGLACLGLIMLAWFVELPRLRTAWKQWLSEAALLVVIPCLVYFTTFAVHFALLPKTGDGDAFMSPRFQQTLIGSPTYDPSVHMSLWDKFIDLNHAMNASEASLKTATHPYGSRWYTWPVMARPVYYWQGDMLENGNQGNIYLLGNPLIWWGVLLGFIAAPIIRIARPRLRHPHQYALLFLGVGYVANFLPFSRIDRVMFLYHYFFALIFSLAFVLVALAPYSGWDSDTPRPWHFSSDRSRRYYFGLIAIVLLGFIYISPLSYGWPLSPGALMHHFWLPTWR